MEAEKTLNIVYLIHSTEISGGLYVACEHATRLKRRGHRVTFAFTGDGDAILEWFPDFDIPIVSLGDVPEAIDALIATWWETVYSLAEIPAKAKFYLIQGVESRFYDDEHGIEAFLSALSYQFNYHFMTVAQWLAGLLGRRYKREVCVVPNQLNPKLFYPIEPPQPASRPAGCTTFLNLRMRSQLPTKAKIYTDEGSGFSEERVISFDIADGWTEKFLSLKGLSRINKIRIDTGKLAENSVEISSIRLIGGGGAEIDLLHGAYWRRNPHVRAFSFNEDVLSISSSGFDPCIICDIDEGMSSRFRQPGIERGGKKLRIVVEGPIGIKFKGVKRALKIAMDTGCEVWFVEGKERDVVLDGFLAHRVFSRVPLEKMKYIYASCDILLKLSSVESFAYPPLEMMACGGIPVVGDVEGVHEYMIDGYNGLIVDGDNEGQIKNALLRLVNDEGLRERIKKGCRETAEKQSNWEGSIDILEGLLREKVSGSLPGPEEKSVTVSLSARELIDLYHDLSKHRDRRSLESEIERRDRYIERLEAGINERFSGARSIGGMMRRLLARAKSRLTARG